MKIQIFSDIHGDTRALERLLNVPADLYIAAGDLSTFGRGLEEAGELLERRAGRVWVLPGNHETAEDVREFCARHEFVDFHRQVRLLGGAHWAGLGYSNPTPFNTPGEYTEEEIAAELARFDGLARLYLVVHFPPHGTRLDEVAPGRHAGSRTLREWIEREKPVALFCGHIHECAGRSEPIGGTQCFNVGKAGYLMNL